MALRNACLPLVLIFSSSCGDDSGGNADGSSGGEDDTTATSATMPTTLPPSTTTPPTETDPTDPMTSGSTGDPPETTTGPDETTGGGDTVEELWTYTYNGGDNGDDLIAGVTVDGDGNIYAAGTTEVAGDENVWAVRLDPEGNEDWAFTGQVGGRAAGIALLPGGDVVVGGWIAVPGEGDNTLVMRITGDAGAEVWADSFSGAATMDDGVLGIGVDGLGDIVAAGFETTTEGTDIWLRKYDADGGTTWTTVVPGDAMEDDAAAGVAFDSSDNILITGWMDAGLAVSDGIVAQYDTGGAEVWTTTISPAAFQFMRAVTVDGDDNAIVTGRSGDDDLSIFVGGYDSSGAEVWTDTQFGPAGGSDYGRGIANDANDNVYVAGYVNVPAQFLDVWARRYAAGGGSEWTVGYQNEESGLDDIANDVAVDADNNVIIGGFETVILEGTNAWLRKYSQP